MIIERLRREMAMVGIARNGDAERRPGRHVRRAEGAAC